MDDLAAIFRLSESLQNLMLTTAMCSIRLFAAFSLLPATSEEFLPGTARRAVILVIGFFIAFGIPADAARSLSGMMLVGIALKELLIGLLIGFSASTVFWVAESAGALIDMQAGYNSVQLTNPLSGEQSTPVSGLLLQMMVAVFYVLGGMVMFIDVLIRSFRVWPLLSLLPSMKGLSEMLFLAQIDRMMSLIVKFSAPVVLVLLLIELGTGLITRAADKLEPHSLSQPIKGAVTMLMLALMASVLMTQVGHFLLPTGLIDRLTTLIPSK